MYKGDIDSVCVCKQSEKNDQMRERKKGEKTLLCLNITVNIFVINLNE